ncbi:MAG: MopE-related protein, partial [Myxococcota bacterium]
MKTSLKTLNPRRVVLGGGSLVILSSLLWGAIASLPTSGVTLNDSPPAVPCTSTPCTYDPLSYSTARFYGPASSSTANNQEVGTTLAAGDFDGDGITDYAFGAPKFQTNKGAVYVYYGTSAAGLTTSVDLGSGIVIQGRTSNANGLGSSLAVGDITGDGKTDLIIGAPTTSVSGSSVYVLVGSSTRWTSQTGTTGIEATSGLIRLETGANASELGSSLAVGDVGAATGKPDPASDGKLDLLIGAPGVTGGKGAAYLLYGPITASSTDITSSGSIFTFTGGSSADRAGGSVAIYGSVTESSSQNGLPDLAIGAFDASSSNGKLYLIEGRARDYFTQAFSGSTGNLDAAGIYRKRTIVGDLTGAQLGYAISGIGDVNGDGFNDLAFSAPKAAGPSAEPERGRVYVLFGSTTVLDAGSANLSTLTSIPYFYGDTNYDRLGVSLSRVGDGDGDAYSDFVVGSRYDTDSTSFFGAAYLTRGRVAANWSFASAKIDGVRFTGPRVSDEAGKAVLGIGDPDGDGYDDFLIGAPGSDASSGQTDNKGRIYLISPGDYLDRDSDSQDRAAGDCDDLDNSRRYRTDGTETCDGKDNDCDGLVDGADSSLTGTPYYTDADGDGYGSSTSPATQGCSSSPPSGKVTNNTDCDDTNAAIKPGATEVCDSKDNDCDTLIDDNDSPVSNQTTWYRDADNDTYGDNSVSTAKCTKPSGYVAQNGDCNDNDSTVNPAKTEVCNSKDDDCDTLIDDLDPTVSNQTTYYFDGDSDGYGR